MTKFRHRGVLFAKNGDPNGSGLQDDILSLCRDLTERHPLRGFDALHLASALILQRDLGEKIAFTAADARLLEAAAAEHLLSINVEKPPGEFDSRS